jgi:hypothetical protein
MHVAKRDHVFETIFSPIIVATAPPKLCRVLEGAKDHVPDREISEVVGVMTELMMNAMGLRALEEVAEPSRCFDIPVIEKFAGCDE